MLKSLALARPVAASQSGRAARPRRSRRGWRMRPALSGPLLIDASEPGLAGGALRLAEALARRDRVTVQVLAVVPPLPSLLSLGASVSADLGRHELDECRLEVARNRTRALVSEAVGPSSFFRTGAVLGRVVPEMGAAARAAAASYVLSGLAPAGTPARQRAADRLSRLATAGRRPVLAVPADRTVLPRSVLAAVDLGGASLAAARAAVPLLGQEASLTLMHVLPGVEAEASDGQGSAEAEIQEATHVLRCLADEIHAVSDVPVHVVVLEGEPASVLARWQSRFDLVTLGASRRGKGRVDPSAGVSTAVFRVAGGAVLVAPADEAGAVTRWGMTVGDRRREGAGERPNAAAGSTQRSPGAGSPLRGGSASTKCP